VARKRSKSTKGVRPSPRPKGRGAPAENKPAPSELVALFDEHRPAIKLWLDTVRTVFQEVAPAAVRDTIHSVRTRIKDRDNLADKITRKRSEDGRSITAANFFRKVQDLAGVRVITLYRWDCKILDDFIRTTGLWTLLEGPVVHAGSEADREMLVRAGFKLKRESKGNTKSHRKYTSIHYVVAPSNAPKAPWMRCEIQVRGLHIEGWAEVEHRFQYPDKDPGPFAKSILAALHEATVVTDRLAQFVRDAVQAEVDRRNAEARLEAELAATKAELAALQKRINDNPKENAKELKPAVDRATGRVDRSTVIFDDLRNNTFVTARQAFIEGGQYFSAQADYSNAVRADGVTGADGTVVGFTTNHSRCDKCGAVEAFSSNVLAITPSHRACSKCGKRLCKQCFDGKEFSLTTYSDCQSCRASNILGL
jgi:ppGpp synthetase/RelA/SpoT-type nucleotidyltranferase